MPERAYDEHCLAELSDGRLWMTVRTTYGIGQAFSSDGGRTWENIGPSGPNARNNLVAMLSGRRRQDVAGRAGARYAQ